MKEGKASFSAEIIAAMRALESRRPEKLRICYDPYARHLIRGKFRFVAQSRLVTKLLYAYIEKKGPGLPAGIAARTRYIDDIVKHDIANGAKQVVIMGAGLDMRPFRLDVLKDIHVFEVDFPATQALKREKLKSIELPERHHLTYVPIDFNKDDLGTELAKAGYDSTIKTLFIWEGVTMYLDADSVDTTLKYIASNSAPESTLYFDYLFQSVLDGRNMAKEAVLVRETKSFNGHGTEKYTFGIEETEIEVFLSERGFQLLQHTFCTIKDGRVLPRSYFVRDRLWKNPKFIGAKTSNFYGILSQSAQSGLTDI